MSSEWRKTTLNDICLKITDGAHQSPKSDENGKPMCSVKDLTEFGLNIETARLISVQDFENLVRQGCMPLVGDVLIAKDGNTALDTVCSIDAPIDVVLLSSVAILRPDPQVLDTVFLKYYFKSKQTLKYLKSNFISGAAIPRVVLRDFKKAEITLPGLEQQKDISKHLRTLDDKIQLNHQINQTLEQMAQAIFKSWFVDFEPVKAKIAARERWYTLQSGNDSASPTCYAGELAGQPIDLETYMNHAAIQAISGKDAEQLTWMQSEKAEEYAELYATAELFPSAMQDSELGEIPKGWFPVTLEHFIDLVYGKALKKTDRIEGPYSVYGSGGITGSHNQSLVNGPGIIIGRKGTVGSIYWESGNFFPIDTTYYVVVKEGCSLLFAYYLLQTLGLEHMNTDAAVPGLNRNNVYRLELPHYPTELIERFSQLADSLSKQITIFSKESNTLTLIRDTLLPKLLSGELSVADIESEVEA